MRRILVPLALGVPCLAASSMLWAQVPVGDQFQVNTYTAGNQWGSGVAGAAGCDFVVTWESEGSLGSDSDRRSIQARRVAPDGRVIGTEFQVNTYTTGMQRNPDVTVAPDCSFVLVWESDGSSGTDTDSRSIQGMRFSADGSPVAAEFQTNTSTTGSQTQPSIDRASDGSFVVAWNGADIQAQRFRVDGSFLGAEFQVNTIGGIRPDLAVSPTGDFVVVWHGGGSYGTDQDSSSIQGQRFSSDGAPTGNQFQVNTHTASSQTFSRVSMAANGSFVVVWQNRSAFGTDNYGSVQGQVFAFDGGPIGGEFQLNTYTTDYQTNVDVQVEPDGQFLVVWESQGSFGTDTSTGSRSVQARLFDQDGIAPDPEFQVNTYTTGSQGARAVASDDNGTFSVVWSSAGSPGSDDDSSSVQARLYSTALIFADGFESGDTSAWSSTQ